ncbi:MAG: sensor histidine kinase [Clostridiaceae bacterium]
MKHELSYLVKKMPIFRLMLLSYLLLIFVILVIVSAFFYYNSVNLSIDKTNKYTYSILNELNNQITIRVQNIIDASFNFANNTELKYYLRNYKNADALQQLQYESEIKKIIDNYWMLRPEILNINVFAKNKKYWGGFDNGVYPLEKVEGMEWFKTLGDRKGVLVDTHIQGLETSIKKLNVITALVRIQSDLGDDLGIISVDLSEDYYYNKLLAVNKASNNSKIFIINGQGMAISNENKAELGKKGGEEVYLSNARTGNSNSGGYQQIRINGKKMLLIYTDLSKINWRIVELIPMSELYIGLERIQLTVLIIAVICILLAVPLALYLSGFITGPIARLAKVMKQFMGEESKDKIQTDFSNEIGELYKNYNHMVDKISFLLDDIRQSDEIQRQTEIKLLQAQINPHFLYNTLDSINWAALNLNVPEISKMVTMLSRFFRLSLSKGSFMCTVRDEVEHARYYMEIQKVCHQNEFDYCIDVEQDAIDCQIPKIILQPLIENSIIHGFERKTAGGIIRISIYVDGKALCLSVIDNGKGIRKENIPDILSKESKKGGYGVKNVHERIQYTCGKEYGLSYVAGEPPGTHVKIVLPVTRGEE